MICLIFFFGDKSCQMLNVNLENSYGSCLSCSYSDAVSDMSADLEVIFSMI